MGLRQSLLLPTSHSKDMGKIKITPAIVLCFLNFTFVVDVWATQNDVIAQGACVGMNNQEGWVYAVRRNCVANQPNCKEICELSSLASQDPQVASKVGECEMALHVYASRPELSGYNQLGPKVYRYKSCLNGGCSP